MAAGLGYQTMISPIIWLRILGTTSFLKELWRLIGFNPNAVGEYTITLTAFDVEMDEVASTSILIKTVSAVPEPASLASFAAIGLFASIGFRRSRRRRRGHPRS